MGKQRVVVTGLGVLAANGIGKDAFLQALFKGRSGIKPISLFDTSEFPLKEAGEIQDFAPEQFLGTKGLRTLDRSVKLLCSAVKLAWDDARLEIKAENSDNIGVAVGTTLGSVSSVSDFQREAIKEGPRYVNPAFFSNTVINSAPSQVAIRFNLRGFSVAMATGFCSGIDAINYAADFIRLGRVRIVLAGAVEELCVQTFIGFSKAGLLAGPENKKGIILGEGSGILVLEDLDSARERQADIYAEVLGSGKGLGLKEGLEKAMQKSLQESNLTAGDVDYICSGANSSHENDLAEGEAIRELFGNPEKITLNRIKPLVGECYSASGSLQAVAAAAVIERKNAENVLINAFGPWGNNSSLVMHKFER